MFTLVSGSLESRLATQLQTEVANVESKKKQSTVHQRSDRWRVLVETGWETLRYCQFSNNKRSVRPSCRTIRASGGK